MGWGKVEHKSGKISGTRKDRGKVAMESLKELTNALSNGTIPDPYGLLPQDFGFATPPKTLIAIISGVRNGLHTTVFSLNLLLD